MCLLLFSSLITIGQVIFSLGLSLKSWPVMFLGRLIFGFGGESFTVANSALLAQWFKGKELAFAFGVNLSISKLGSVVNNLVSPVLTDDVSILFALWFGAILCAFCVGCVLVTMPIDLAMENKVRANLLALNQDASDNKAMIGHVQATTINELHSSGNSGSTSSRNSKNDDGDEVMDTNAAPEASLKDVFQLQYIFWILVLSCMVVYGCVLPFNNISSSLLLERDYFQETPSGCMITNPLYCQNDQTNPYTTQCPTSKWYQPPLPLNATLSTNELYNPLSTSDIDCNKDEWKNNCATNLYCSRLNSAESQASVIMSIPYIISACLSPPLGYAIDLYGFRAVIAAIAPAILILVHLLLGITKINPVGPLVGQGLAYTGFVSVLWPAVPLVVEERETGLAFGIVTSGQNLATAVIPLIAASIYTDNNDHYCPGVELLFVALAAVGFVVGLYLNIYDWGHGHHLNGRWWRVGCGSLMLKMGIITKVEYMKLCQPLAGEDAEVDSVVYMPVSTLGADDQVEVHAMDISKEKDQQPGGLGAEDIYRDRVRSRSRSRSQSQSASNRNHGGSFTSYEEAMRGGAFRTAGGRNELLGGGSERQYSQDRHYSRDRTPSFTNRPVNK